MHYISTKKGNIILLCFYDPKKWQQQGLFFCLATRCLFYSTGMFLPKNSKNMFLLCFHQKIATDCFIYVCAKFNNNKFLFLFLQKGNNIFFIFLSIKVTSCFCLRYCLKTTTAFSSFRISTK